jgi:hypothetical protein
MTWLQRLTRGSRRGVGGEQPPRQSAPVALTEIDDWLVAWGGEAAIVYKVPPTADRPGHIRADGVRVPG